MRKRILRNVLHGLQYLHSYGIVHGDIHMGNILVTIRPLECDAGTIADLKQRPEDGEPLKRRDGKQDLWAPPYQLVPAGLLEYNSTELDPYVKIADIGGSFRVQEPPTKIITPPEFRAPETLLGLPVGAGIDIWSFGCLAFLIVTGYHLFAPNDLLGSDEAIRDMNLIQFSEVIGPLPETMFRAWTRGALYFAPDRKSRLEKMIGEGEDGNFSFMRMDTDDVSQSDGGTDDKDGGGLLHQDGVDYKEDAASGMSEVWSELSTDEELLIMMAHCHSLEQRFCEKKPEDIDEVEGQNIIHLLRWIFQYDAAARPTAVEILNHPWFQT
ncbi:hypothetical protein N0V82_008865 [Gnomoniopsis sp. IMI 355080]|nr:hypothetical protein N0V82_008865 [Gnomoniopsis sp. IMI 355080]